jgi:hypothetical protein
VALFDVVVASMAEAMKFMQIARLFDGGAASVAYACGTR